jgi:hypothetical protein
MGTDVLRQADDLATIGARRAKLYRQTEVVAGFAASFRVCWQGHRDRKSNSSKDDTYFHDSGAMTA